MIKILEFLNIITLSDKGNISDINSGTIASIISLFITIGIFFGIRKIKSYYIFTARVPEILDKLDQNASKIANYFNDFENSIRQISLEIAEVEVGLTSLKKKVKGKTKTSVTRLLNNIKSYEGPKIKLWTVSFKKSGTSSKFKFTDKEKLWKLYIDLYKLIAEIKELQEDYKWER